VTPKQKNNYNAGFKNGQIDRQHGKDNCFTIGLSLAYYLGYRDGFENRLSKMK